MAMTKQLWSINALATELDRDRRTIAAALKDVAPDGKLGSHPAWFLVTVLAALSPAPSEDDGLLDPAQERARKDKELADKTAMENATRRRELLPRDEVHIAVTAAFTRVRTKLLAIPNKAAPLVVHAGTIASARDILMSSVTEALSELAATIVAGSPVGVRGSRAPRRA